MSDSGKPRSYCTKMARRVRRKRLEIWRMRSVRLMDNFKPPATDGPVFVDGICSRKKRRSGIDEAPSLEPGTFAAKAKPDAGDGSLALEQSVSVSVSSEKCPEDGASPSGISIAGGKLSEEEGMSKSTCISHGSISVIGRRRVMEDAVTMGPEMVPGELSFFAVYDGHGGSRVANACRDRLHQLLLNELYSRESSAGVSVGLGGGAEIDWEKVMMACFGKMDEEVSGGGTELEGASASSTTVGSTAVVVLVGKEEIVVANCGDSRAVLGGGGGALPLSDDHKPDRPDERERVEAIGGRVINWNGSRVLGVLATSRSIGDHYLKPFVISEPEVTVRKRTKSDNFLIIASDGLWDVVSNEVACDVVGKCLHSRMRKRFSEETTAAEAAAMLAELAIAKGSKDNISVIVVELQKFG